MMLLPWLLRVKLSGKRPLITRQFAQVRRMYEAELPSAGVATDTGGVTSDAQERQLLPIACTLGPSDGAARLEEWRRVADAAGRGRTVGPSRVTLRFVDEPGVGDELRRLVAAERDCCAFLGWDVAYAEGEWRVEVTGSDEELQALSLGLGDEA